MWSGRLFKMWGAHARRISVHDGGGPKRVDGQLVRRRLRTSVADRQHTTTGAGLHRSLAFKESERAPFSSLYI